MKLFINILKYLQYFINASCYYQAKIISKQEIDNLLSNIFILKVL